MATSTATSGNDSKQCKCKVVLLGEMAVGKSSLVLRFARGLFRDYHEPTIGAAFVTQTMQLDDGVVKFEIWDTAGQERYHALAPMYYRNASAALVVYDLTSSESFERAKTWLTELQRQAPADVIIALVGNKADLAGNNRCVSVEEVQALAETHGGLVCVETSAKTGYNVTELFVAIGRRLKAAQTMSRHRWNPASRNDGVGGVRLGGESTNSESTRQSCCGGSRGGDSD